LSEGRSTPAGTARAENPFLQVHLQKLVEAVPAESERPKRKSKQFYRVIFQWPCKLFKVFNLKSKLLSKDCFNKI
jgi:hypothetical protein